MSLSCCFSNECLLIDGSGLGTYESWLKASNNAVKTIPNIVKVYLDDTFIIWCKTNNLPLTSKTRQLYAAYKAAKEEE